MVRNDIKKEFGDYQTPGYFAVKVCNLLKDKLKISPAVHAVVFYIHASKRHFPGIHIPEPGNQIAKC